MFLVRVSLPDVPGSLGSVATAMGSVGADIVAVEIVQKLGGTVIDDFMLTLPTDKLPDALVSACQGLDGVNVEWISRYPEGGGLQSDLETLERMTADPEHAAETLVAAAPTVFRSHWSTLLQLPGHPGADRTGSEDDGQIHAVYSTDHAPRLDHAAASRLAPFDSTHRLVIEGDWLPGYDDSTVVVAPIDHDRVVVVGRIGGPAFLDSEIARLNHLAHLIPTA